jgi:hypothetical protein
MNRHNLAMLGLLDLLLQIQIYKRAPAEHVKCCLWSQLLRRWGHAVLFLPLCTFFASNFCRKSTYFHVQTLCSLESRCCFGGTTALERTP